MADGDVYKIDLVSELGGVASSFGFSFRADVDGPVGQEFNDVLDMVETNIVPNFAQAVTGDMKFVCIAARRTLGITSSTFTRFIDVVGTKVVLSLPTTSYLKLQYYPSPIRPKTAYSMRIPGITEVSTKEGIVNKSSIDLFDAVISFMLTDPITHSGNQYRWVTNQNYTLPSGLNDPITSANVKPVVFNLRSRQGQLCS